MGVSWAINYGEGGQSHENVTAGFKSESHQSAVQTKLTVWNVYSGLSLAHYIMDFPALLMQCTKPLQVIALE